MKRDTVHSDQFHGVAAPLLGLVHRAVESVPGGFRIGRRWVTEGPRFAHGQGCATLSLWTNDILISVRRIYEAAGFKLMREERHHSFGHDLVGQYWILDLE